ncbi:FtsX-like permease family protein [Dactylosporangium sp. NPDC051541]|uniref:FtsX-like permease family protein n=1 Tax=Dactylosporangium sp. NPDC051541 TaxID=3363977 RepID=UPI0037B1B58B
MIPFIWAHLAKNKGRSVALLLGVLVATTGFTVLTGATDTARLQVTGEVNRSAAAAYQVLVRPKGTRTALENDRQKVRPNSLSGIYGGITPEQARQIAALDGVDVAAPIAMVGYANKGRTAIFDITNLLDQSLDRQLIRLDKTFLADRGLSTAKARSDFVYVTKHTVAWPNISAGGTSLGMQYTDGSSHAGKDMCDDGLAVLEDGVPVCQWIDRDEMSNLMRDTQGATLQVIQLMPDGKYRRGFGGISASELTTEDKAMAYVSWQVPMLLAAVDPQAEARLVGLDGAVTAGHYIGPADKLGKQPPPLNDPILPVLSVEQPYPDNGLRVDLSRIALTAPPPGDRPANALAMLDATTGPKLETRTLNGNPEQVGWGHHLAPFMRVGGVDYTENADGSLTAVPVPTDPEAWRSPNISGIHLPWQIYDTSFRTVKQTNELGFTDIVGLYDPGKVRTFDPLSKVPMETYQAPDATGGDQRSRDLLNGQTLRPDGNPAGYLATSPTLLTSLDLLDSLYSTLGLETERKAPISAVRVRVADVHGFDAAARERVRVVAERIAAVTGLDVDITYGSSPQPQAVDIAAGQFGRPALRLSELWTRKGVAAAIVSAVDRKSVVLFALVLVVCALFLANAVFAGVRDRRTELATLTALGWPAHRVFGVVLGEVAVLGLVAGAGTMLLAGPLGHLLDVGVPWHRALLAVPIALALALLAGLLPALAAARARPAKGLRPVALRPRRAGRPRGPIGLGLRNLLRVPGRTLLGAGALAIGITAATVLGAITFAFHGAIVGTMLGDAVSLQVRAVDTVAVGATVLLGALAVADVLYLNIRDRSAELATLRATGWTAGALGRLVAAEGFGIGVLGGLTGAGLGLGGAAWLVGSVTLGLLWTAAAALVAGALVATVAAIVPALLLQRLPTARLLAEE